MGGFNPFRAITRALGITRKRPAPPPAPVVTPEVTPEVVPDDETIMGTRRRTKGKRSGQGGTIIEGYGSLYRGGSEKSIGG
jgi:hypothetical protein